MARRKLQLALGFARDERQPQNLAEIGGSGYQDAYQRLRAQGWHWRKAAFMAWRAAPAGSRKPGTQAELATLLGLKSDRTFRKWLRKNPEMRRIIDQARMNIFEYYLADVDWVTIRAALDPNKTTVADRRLFYERWAAARLLSGEGEPTTDDVERLDDAELEAEIIRLFEQAGEVAALPAQTGAAEAPGAA